MKSTPSLKFIFCIIVALFLTTLSSAQNYIINGYITDQKSGEALIGAVICCNNPPSGTTTNNFGLFQLHLPSGRHHLIAKYVGYEQSEFDISLTKDTIINLQLKTNNILKEVIISDNKYLEFLSSPTIGINHLNAEQIKNLPSMLGEPDLLKVIQMLPGVTLTSEGKSEGSVRGGSPDQTLILLDGVPVYNTNHLFGFFSTFNSDVINNVALYKGSMPARYGERLSSVLDISTKEGNIFKKQRTFSIGTLAGRLSIEGPLSSGKISYSIAGRRTWLDLPIHLGQILNYDEEISYDFWDINGKINWKISNKDRLFLSFYASKDAFIHKDKEFAGMENETNYHFDWQNQTLLVRWNHFINPNMFMQTSAYLSRLLQEEINKPEKDEKEYQKEYNDLYDISIKSDISYSAMALHDIKFGYLLSKKYISPEIIEIKYGDSVSIFNKDVSIKNNTLTGYFEDEWTISKDFKINYGLRSTWYNIRTTNYFGLEPRLALDYKFNSKITIKASYSRMKQYMHILSNNSIGVPVDMWVASTKRVVPETSDLISSGLFYQLNDNINISLEGYYSTMRNLVHYIEGAEYYKLAGQSWENYVTTGKGNSFGTELWIEKKCGQLTGWFSYTLSWSNRLFKDLNNGKKFPYEYDRRHQLKICGNYVFNEKETKNKKVKHTVSASFVFLSGNCISFPTQEYHAAEFPFLNNNTDDILYSRSYTSSINNLRMPPFHHLDIGYQISIEKKGKLYIWDFSVYNIYNHLNVFYYYKKDGQIKQVSFFPILPSVSFTYRY
jgi:outer membrane receptor for ferrienterochelin and colicin